MFLGDNKNTFMEDQWFRNLLLDSLMTLFQFKRFCSVETNAKIVINGEKWTYSRSLQNTMQKFDSIDLRGVIEK